MTEDRSAGDRSLACALRWAAKKPEELAAEEAEERKRMFGVLYREGMRLCRKLPRCPSKPGGSGEDWTNILHNRLLRLWENGIDCRRELPATDAGARAYLRATLFRGAFDQCRAAAARPRLATVRQTDGGGRTGRDDEPAVPAPQAHETQQAVELSSAERDEERWRNAALRELYCEARELLSPLPTGVGTTLAVTLRFLAESLLDALASDAMEAQVLVSEESVDQDFDRLVDTLRLLLRVCTEATTELSQERYQKSFADSLRALVLVYLKAATYESLSVELGIQEPALRKRVQRARDTLFEAMARIVDGGEMVEECEVGELSASREHLAKLLDTMKLAARGGSESLEDDA